MKQELKKLIAEGKTKQAIKALLEVTENQKDLNEDVVAVSARYKNYERKKMQGTTSNEELDRNLAQINQSVIIIIDRLEVNNTKTSRINWKWLSVTALLLSILAYIAFEEYFTNSGNGANEENLQLTVFVTNAEGNVVLEHEGELNIPLGNSILNAKIGENGRTNFGEIPQNLKGKDITIGLEAEGWEIGGSNTFIFTGVPIHLQVKRDNSLGTIKGVVKSRDGEKFIQEAEVRINNDTIISTDENGIFKIVLPIDMQVKNENEGYTLTVRADGYRVATDMYYPKSTDSEIRLEKR